MRNFIRLRTDDNPATHDYCFRVVMGTWKPDFTRTQTRRRSVTGVADTAEGIVVKSFNGVILCSASPRDHFDNVYVNSHGVIDPSGSPCKVGTLDNLVSLFALNDPSASPSSRLWLYDFTTSYVGGDFFAYPVTNAHYVEFVGKISPENLSPMMEGTEAQFTVAISMEQVQ